MLLTLNVLVQMCLYIHKEASLTNIPDRLLRTPLFADFGDDGRKTFHLGSFKDIHHYWLSFQTASLDITAGKTFKSCFSYPIIRNSHGDVSIAVCRCWQRITFAEPPADRSGKKKRFKSKEEKLKFFDCLKAKAANEIVDDGRLPGDGLGPGGTDSTLHAYYSIFDFEVMHVMAIVDVRWFDDRGIFRNLRKNWCQSKDGCIQVESFAFSGYTKKHPRIKKETTLTSWFLIISLHWHLNCFYSINLLLKLEKVFRKWNQGWWKWWGGWNPWREVLHLAPNNSKEDVGFCELHFSSNFCVF